MLGIALATGHLPALARRTTAFVLAALALSMLMFSCAPAHAQTIPSAAKSFQRDLTRIVQQEWGLGGSVAVHAAQIHQESAWRPNVSSHAGAQGLSQFMPATSAWMAEIYPDLGAAAPFSPTWSMRAQVRYNKWHLQRISAIDTCEHWAMALSAYNGGLGWLQRDQRLARAAGESPEVWFGSVEKYTNRAAWAKRENRDYVQRILTRLEPIYRNAGWHGVALC